MNDRIGRKCWNAAGLGSLNRTGDRIANRLLEGSVDLRETRWMEGFYERLQMSVRSRAVLRASDF